MNYLIGIDIGTSGTKTALYDAETGKEVRALTAEYPLSQPENGWAEQNPLDWWEAVVKTLRAVTDGIDGNAVKGIGLSGQMHGVVMLDADGDVIRPAIIWCDGRTAKECEEITGTVGYDKLIELTANPALTGFSASKILWIRNHEPENYAKCRKILLPKDYIRYKLTGAFATEVSDASGTQLLHIAGRCWSDEMLRLLKIDRDLLPEVYESPVISACVSEEAAKLTGLKKGTPVAGGGGDNAASAVGTGVVREGRAFTTVGTSGVVFAHTSKPVADKAGRVHTFCCAVPGMWHVMGVTQAAGLSLRWFRDNFCESELAEAEKKGVDVYQIMDAEAKTSPIGANRLLYLPYLMGERTPHLDPAARGMFFGLSAIHGRPDLIRAVLEGVAFSLRDCTEIFREMGIDTSGMILCGGGAKSPLWAKIIADVYHTDVRAIPASGGGAFGAAILAGVGAGLYPSVEDACDRLIGYRPLASFDPENAKTYDKFYGIYRQVYPAVRNCCHLLQE